MHTAHLLTVSHSIQWGRVCPTPPPPPTEADPPPLGHVTCDACWEANHPWTEGMAHACENITLPQTLFAGGSNQIEYLPGLSLALIHSSTNMSK